MSNNQACKHVETIKKTRNTKLKLLNDRQESSTTSNNFPEIEQAESFETGLDTHPVHDVLQWNWTCPGLTSTHASVSGCFVCAACQLFKAQFIATTISGAELRFVLIPNEMLPGAGCHDMNLVVLCRKTHQGKQKYHACLAGVSPTSSGKRECVAGLCC